MARKQQTFFDLGTQSHTHETPCCCCCSTSQLGHFISSTATRSPHCARRTITYARLRSFVLNPTGRLQHTPVQTEPPSLTRHALDRVVDPQQRHRYPERALERTCLADRGLGKHSLADIVAPDVLASIAPAEIEPVTWQHLLSVAVARTLSAASRAALAASGLEIMGRAIANPATRVSRRQLRHRHG
jgi:hypothetical protein